MVHHLEITLIPIGDYLQTPGSINSSAGGKWREGTVYGALQEGGKVSLVTAKY